MRRGGYLPEFLMASSVKASRSEVAIIIVPIDLFMFYVLKVKYWLRMYSFFCILQRAAVTSRAAIAASRLFEQVVYAAPRIPQRRQPDEADNDIL